jgi:hypothetical protein
MLNTSDGFSTTRAQSPIKNSNTHGKIQLQLQLFTLTTSPETPSSLSSQTPPPFIMATGMTLTIIQIHQMDPKFPLKNTIPISMEEPSLISP